MSYDPSNVSTLRLILKSLRKVFSVEDLSKIYKKFRRQRVKSQIYDFAGQDEEEQYKCSEESSQVYTLEGEKTEKPINMFKKFADIARRELVIDQQIYKEFFLVNFTET